MDPDPAQQLLFILLQTNFLVPLIIISLFLIGSGVISGTEVAFFSLSRKDIEDNREEYPEEMDQIQSLLRDKNRLLSTILILNNFINIGLVVYMAMITEKIQFSGYKLFNSIYISPDNAKMIFDLGVVTFLILLFGEILPKVYAQKYPVQVAIRMAAPIAFFKRLLKPIGDLLLNLTKFVEKNMKGESFSVEQLSQALEITSEDETTTQDEQKILEGIVSFGNSTAKEIMTPRVDMFALEKSTPFVDVVQKVKENGYSRIPVYAENEDDICGILFAKDLIKHLDQKNFDWLQVLKKPYFVPEGKKLDDLLADFQSMKTHIAIVVDEYGGTSGLVSLEDIIEEIVGEISDEFDDDSVRYTKIDDNTYVFDGKTSIKDFLRIVNDENDSFVEDAKGDAETIAGFLIEQIEGLPKRNQTIKFHQFTFTIESVNNKRIKRIKVSINEKKDPVSN